MTNAESSNPINISGLIIVVFFSTVISGILIWIVGLLSLGLTVDDIGAASLAGLAVAVTGGVISWLLNLGNLKLGAGVLGAILNILLGAVVLVIGGKLIPGLTQKGFIGALITSVAIYAISWLLSIIPKRINQAASQAEANEFEP